jgi:transcriptional regulator with XRE-family HTH domain
MAKRKEVINLTATNLLKAKLIEMGYRQEDIADILNISSQSFSYKLNNKREFKASEIDTLCSVLKIQNKDAYFFCRTNSQNG